MFRLVNAVARHRPILKDVRYLAFPAIALLALPAMAATVTVNVDGMAFVPAEIHAQAGDTINWVNKDPVAHTATARNKAFNVMLPAGKTTVQKITKTGSFDFYCTFHPNMTGKLVVAPAASK